MSPSLRDRIGSYGIWRRGTEFTPELVAEIEGLGFGAIWLGGSPPADLEQSERLLAATSTLIVGTSIVNIWTADAREVAASFARIESRYPGRFVLGVGTGHREAIQEYVSPYQTLADYVDVLLAEGVPRASLVLAALGPKVLRLAADRTAGAVPYLVPPEHTQQAREVIGPDALLATEHKVVLDRDPVQARAIGGPRVEKPYLGLSNYTNNLRRLGWSDEDLAGSGSDRLIDALVAHGDPAEVADQLRAHLDAGADHVAIQLLTSAGDDPLPGYVELADALGITAKSG